MDWVVSNGRRPAVVSMSLGGGASSTTDAAVKRMYDAGFTVSVAAGNSDEDACGTSPARSGYVSFLIFQLLMEVLKHISFRRFIVRCYYLWLCFLKLWKYIQR